MPQDHHFIPQNQHWYTRKVTLLTSVTASACVMAYLLDLTIFNVDINDRLERTLTGKRDLEQRSPLHRSKPLRLSLNGTSEENIFYVFAHICVCNFFVFLPRPLFVTLYSHLYFPFVLMTALIFVCNFNFISCPTYEP